MVIGAGAPPRCGGQDETEIDMKTMSPTGRHDGHRATHWFARWWQRRRLRLAMHHMAQMSPEFRRDLGLEDATIDDLAAPEDCGDYSAARHLVFGAGGSAPGAPVTGR